MKSVARRLSSAFLDLLVRLDRRLTGPMPVAATGGFSFAEYFIPFMQNGIIYFGLIVLRPARFPLMLASFTLGSMAGAMTLALVAQGLGPAMLDLLPGGAANPDFRRVQGWLAAWGPLALTMLALLSITPRAAVVACAFAGVPIWMIACCVGAGRLCINLAVGLAAAHAPGPVRRRVRRVDRLLTAIEDRQRALSP